MRGRLVRLWPYWIRLVRLAAARGAGGHDAEDLASLTLLRVAEARSLDDEREPWPYLARTLMNLMTDGYRQIAREDVMIARLPAARPLGYEEDVLDRVEVVRVLGRLTSIAGPRTAGMVGDYFAYELTWEQLGERYGISGSAARKQVDRAIRLLRDRIGRE